MYRTFKKANQLICAPWCRCRKTAYFPVFCMGTSLEPRWRRVMGSICRTIVAGVMMGSRYVDIITLLHPASIGQPVKKKRSKRAPFINLVWFWDLSTKWIKVWQLLAGVFHGRQTHTHMWAYAQLFRHVWSEPQDEPFIQKIKKKSGKFSIQLL